MYWWITTITSGGKLVIFGPYMTEDEANDYGFAHLGSNFETHQLFTRDQGKATRILKKKLFDKIHDLDTALHRAGHKLPDGKEVT